MTTTHKRQRHKRRKKKASKEQLETIHLHQLCYRWKGPSYSRHLVINSRMVFYFKSFVMWSLFLRVRQMQMSVLVLPAGCPWHHLISVNCLWDLWALWNGCSQSRVNGVKLRTNKSNPTWGQQLLGQSSPCWPSINISPTPPLHTHTHTQTHTCTEKWRE